MPIPSEIIEQIRTSVDIVDVIGDYVRLSRTGKNWVGLCPFHEDRTPSLAVEPVRGIYKCFACGKGGNVFTFLMENNRWSFPETVRYLGSTLRIEIPSYGEQEQEEFTEHERLTAVVREAALYFYQTLDSEAGSTGRSYLHDRGFTNDSITKFGLGFAAEGWDGLLTHLLAKGYPNEVIERAGLSVKREGKAGWYDRFRGRVLFPVFTIYGKVAGFGARIIGEQKDQPKYLNSPESPIYQKSKLLYGLFQAKEALRRKKRALLVEGYSDVLTLHQAGIEVAVATCGTAVTTDHAEALARLVTSVVVMFDGDSSGRAASYRGIEILLRQGLDVFVLRLPQQEDPDSFIQHHGIEEFVRQMEDSVPFLDFRLHEYHRSGEFDTVERKVIAIRELVKTVAQIPDRIKQELLVQRIAANMKVSEKEVLKVLRSVQPNNYTKQRATGNHHTRQQYDFPQAEYMLLSILVQGDRTQFVEVLSQLDPSDFTDPLCRRCLEFLIEQYCADLPLAVEQMLLTNVHIELREFLTLLTVPREVISEKWNLIDPELLPPNKTLIKQQCISYFLKQRLLQQRTVIMESIDNLSRENLSDDVHEERISRLFEAIESNAVQLAQLSNPNTITQGSSQSTSIQRTP